MKKVCRLFEKFSLVLVLLGFAACSSYVQDIRVSVNEIETTFFVEHWKQTVDGSSYEQDKKADQILTGISMSKTKVKALEYEGFTSQKIEQKTINRDGSTIVKVYYDRNTITYTFNPAGGNWNGSTKDIKVSGLYGAAVPAPENPQKTGYTFCEWDARVPSVFGAHSLTFKSLWAPGTGTPYTVEHWFQNVTANGYEIDAAETEQKVGVTDDKTHAYAKDIDGFTGQPVEQVIVSADGKTVVKIYYNRNTITYTFEPSGGNWNGKTDDVTVKGLYGTAVSLPEGPEKAGYVFSKWKEGVPETFGPQDLTFTVEWTPGTNTKYTVEHLMPKISEEGYDLIATETKYGTTEQQTAASPGEYPGVTYNSTEQCAINGDGSSVAKVYYDRNTITYTFDSCWGSWDGGIYNKVVQGLYGAKVPLPEEPDCDNEKYVFDYWYDSYGNNAEYFDVEDDYFYAEYKYNLYEKVTILPPGTDGSAGTDATYAYFGIWPQTIADARVLDLSSAPFFMGGNEYCWGYDENLYMRCREDKFVQPNTNNTENTSFSYYSDKTEIRNSYRWFKVEPIKWRVLTTNYNNTGNALLVAENILMGGVLYSLTQEEQIINGETVYPNNYKYSNVRAYLNGAYEPGDPQLPKYENIGFLQTAFTESAQDLIAVTHVDNSAVSAAHLSSQISQLEEYECEDTYDKIFLLSTQEFLDSEFGFGGYNTKDKTRVRFVTDYARANHVFCSWFNDTGITYTTVYRNGQWWYSYNGRLYSSINAIPKETTTAVSYWWLRSPGASANGVDPIVSIKDSNCDGTLLASSRVYDPHDGIVPALTISLEN